MYQVNNKMVIIKMMLRVILFFLILILTFKLLSMLFNSRKEYLEKNNINSNLVTVENVAIEYFKNNRIDVVGDKIKLSLNELKEKELISELKDEYNNSCDLDESFIEAYRLEEEYRIKSYLICNNRSDYKFVYLNSETFERIENEETTTVTSETTEATTESTTTTTKIEETRKTTKITKEPTTTTSTTTTSTTTKIDGYITYKVTVPTTRTTIGIDFVKIEFNPNGGELDKYEIIKGKGSKIELPVPRTTELTQGKTFLGWEYKGILFKDEITLTKNMVLIARWK